MNLADWLEKIQRKPYQERLKLLWVCVTASMFIVFCFWLISLNGLVRGNEENENQSLQSQQALNQAGENYHQLKSEVPTLWQALKASILGVADQLPSENLKSTPPENESIFKNQDAPAVSGQQ